MENNIYGEEVLAEPANEDITEYNIDTTEEIDEIDEEDVDIDDETQDDIENDDDDLDYDEEDGESEYIEEDAIEATEKTEAEPLDKKPKEKPKDKVKEMTQKEIDEIVRSRIKEENKAKQRYREENALYIRLAKDALKGIIPENASIEELKKAAAENLGLSDEEYEKRLSQEKELEEYRQYKESKTKKEKDSRIEAIKAAHLLEIKSAMPDIEAEHIEDLPYYQDFSILMSTQKYTPVQAYKAARIIANDSIEADVEKEYEKQRALRDSKNHIRNTKSRRIAPTLVSIPKDEIDNWKGMYPELSNKELATKYNQFIKNYKN